MGLFGVFSSVVSYCALTGGRSVCLKEEGEASCIALVLSV